MDRNFSPKTPKWTPEYHAWYGMLRRCTVPTVVGYAEYGGRGIVVCARWQDSFEAFIADLGPRPSARHSLDRKDVNGPYDPDNCRWATRTEQARNNRRSRRLTHEGRTLTVVEWAEVTGLPHWTIRNRLKQGLSMDEILAPSKPKPHGKNWFDGSSRIRTPEYAAWTAMKQRCLNPKHPAWKDYGERGIGVHAPWVASFDAFLKDMGPRPSPKHSLDREDVNGDYTPNNCRWTDRKTQARNTRTNRMLTVDGQTRSLAEWSERTGLPVETIRSRLRAGWPAEQALRFSPRAR